MNIKNKFGFTLVELLATIVILGLLSTIAIVSVNKYTKSSHQKYYNKQLELFKTTGQTYYTDHKSKLPTINFATDRTTLKTLIDENYINKIVDPNKKACNSDDSFVQVQRMGTGKYVYSAYLKCENKTVGTNKTDILGTGFEIKTDNIREYETAETLGKGWPYTNYYSNNKILFDFIINNTATNKSKLIGYKYKVYKFIDTSNKQIYKESEIIYKEETDKSIKDTIGIGKNKYIDGTYQVTIIPISDDGVELEESLISGIRIIIDTKKPTCSITLPATSATNYKNGWYNANLDPKNRKINFKFEDDNLKEYKTTIGCNDTNKFIRFENENVITRELENTIDKKMAQGIVRDKAGNEGTCNSNSKFGADFDIPNCIIKYKKSGSKGDKPENGNNGWLKDKIDIYLNTETEENLKNFDFGYSRIAKYGLSTTENNFNNVIKTVQGDTTGVNWYGIIQDNAGNVNKCKKENIKIDTMPPAINAFSIVSDDNRYNTIYPNIEIKINDVNKTKYTISNDTKNRSHSSSYYEDNSNKTLTNLFYKNSNDNYNNYNRIDNFHFNNLSAAGYALGNTITLNLTAVDEAGNKSEEKTAEYTLYKICTKTKIVGGTMCGDPPNWCIADLAYDGVANAYDEYEENYYCETVTVTGGCKSPITSITPVFTGRTESDACNSCVINAKRTDYKMYIEYAFINGENTTRVCSEEYRGNGTSVDCYQEPVKILEDKFAECRWKEGTCNPETKKKIDKELCRPSYILMSGENICSSELGAEEESGDTETTSPCSKPTTKHMYLCRNGNTYVHWEPNVYSSSCNQTVTLNQTSRFTKKVAVKIQKEGNYYVLKNPMSTGASGCSEKKYKYIYKGCLEDTKPTEDCISKCIG